MSFLKMENMKLYHIFSNKKIQILTENSIINFFLESVFFKNWLETPSNARIFNYLQKKKKRIFGQHETARRIAISSPFSSHIAGTSHHLSLRLPLSRIR